MNHLLPTSYSSKLMQGDEDEIDNKINPKFRSATYECLQNFFIICCYNILQKYNLCCDL